MVGDDEMKYLLLILLALTACDRKPTGEIRHSLFVECMELAAKMPRQSDDDVGDIVSACGSHAYYTANHIGQDKAIVEKKDE